MDAAQRRSGLAQRNGAAVLAQRNVGPAAAKDTNAVAPSSRTLVALLRFCNDAIPTITGRRCGALLSEAFWRLNMPGCWPGPAEIAVREAASGRGPVRAVAPLHQRSPARRAIAALTFPLRPHLHRGVNAQRPGRRRPSSCAAPGEGERR
jgi:hypothetical protein